MSKITRAKWTGGVAQAVGSPLCKCKALSSNYSPTKKQKTRTKIAKCQQRATGSFWYRNTMEHKMTKSHCGIGLTLQ
jgi:hypothetical protein